MFDLVNIKWAFYFESGLSVLSTGYVGKNVNSFQFNNILHCPLNVCWIQPIQCKLLVTSA